MRGRGIKDFTAAEREQIRQLVAAGDSVSAIAAAFDVGRSTIQRAVAAYDLGPWRTRFFGNSPTPAPEGFAEAFLSMSLREVAERFGVHRETAGKWAKRLGLIKPKPEHPLPPVQSPRHQPLTSTNASRLPGTKRYISETIRNMTLVGQAVDYLRRFGAVYRCNERGGAVDKGGTHWRRGSAVLTDGEVVDRAKRLGFDPDGWRKLAA